MDDILKNYTFEMINRSYDAADVFWINNLLGNMQRKEKRTKKTIQRIDFNNDICIYHKWIFKANEWIIKDKKVYLKNDVKNY